MKAKEVSKNKWAVEVTDEDKGKINCLLEELSEKVETIKEEFSKNYGKWKENMNSEEFIWKTIISQFCVTRGTQMWCKLKEEREDDYKEFMEKMKLDNLVNKENRVEFLRDLFRKYKPNPLVRKQGKVSSHPDVPERIDRFLSNKKVVKDGKLVLFDDLNSRANEDEMRDILLRRCDGRSFRMKSISDLMIDLGMTKNLIAFDARIVGLLIEFFDLSVWTKSGKLKSDKTTGRIQGNKILYKKMEEKLRDVCREIGIELSLLDRILFAKKSEIEHILKTECV